MNVSARSVALVVICCVLPTQTSARDVRSIGMGGASVSSGQGVGGAISNPSSLMSAQRQKQRYHFGLSFHSDVRDSDGLIKELTDNDDLIVDIEGEIDSVAEQTVTCIPGVTADTDPCLSDTATLGSLAGDALEVFNNIDEAPLEGTLGSDIGFAVSHTSIPFFINLGVRVTGAAEADITEADKAYAQTLNDVLGDGILTFAEIEASSPITLTAGNDSVNVSLPDDVLNSEASGGAVLRTQLSMGFARTFKLSNNEIDVGVTPKISSLTASDITKSISDLADDTRDDLVDELEEDETTETTFTFDIGASMALPSNKKLSFAGVVKNVVTESIETKNGLEFETTPQAIVSSMYADNWYKFTADLALNEAKLDNLKTQRLSIGTELGAKVFRFRAGVLHDLAVDNDPTEFSLGVGLGFFDIAVSLNGSSIKGGLQLAFSL